MKSLPEILSWIQSCSQRFARQGYTPPNHLANGEVRFIKGDDVIFVVKLDAQGNAPDYEMNPPPDRIEVYGSQSDLLYTEEG